MTDPAVIRRAIAAGRPIGILLVREGELSAEISRLVEEARLAGVPVSIESAREMRRMSEDDVVPEILAMEGAAPATDLGSLMTREGVVFVLVGLRYPANVGFILRSAEVAGAAGVVVSNHWSDAEWAEARRVGMRADRFLSVLPARADAAVEAAVASGRRVVAVETSGESTPWTTDLTQPSAFLIGSEATGIPGNLLARADEVLRIPSFGFIPSYNVQAATSILLGEYLRQSQLRQAHVELPTVSR